MLKHQKAMVNATPNCDQWQAAAASTNTTASIARMRAGVGDAGHVRSSIPQEQLARSNPFAHSNPLTQIHCQSRANAALLL